MLAKALLSLLLSLSLLLPQGGALSPFPEAEFTPEDVVCYLDGLIGATYLGRFDPAYLELTGITEEEARETYDWFLAAEGEFFAYYCDFEPSVTEEFLPRLKELYAQVYQAVRYKLGPAVPQPDGSYTVEVTTEPIDVIRLLNGDFDAHMEPFFEKYPNEVIETLNDEEFLALEREWAGMILELFEEKLPQMGHLEAQTLLVRVERDGEGGWTVRDEDLIALDEAMMIQYDI